MSNDMRRARLPGELKVLSRQHMPIQTESKFHGSSLWKMGGLEKWLQAKSLNLISSGLPSFHLSDLPISLCFIGPLQSSATCTDTELSPRLSRYAPPPSPYANEAESSCRREACDNHGSRVWVDRSTAARSRRNSDFSPPTRPDLPSYRSWV